MPEAKSGKHYDDCYHQIDKALIRKVAWKYIRTPNYSYKKLAKEFGLSEAKVGHMLRKELPEVSKILYWLYNLRKKDNVNDVKIKKGKK